MRGIHHAGIVVSDIDRAIDFYTGILGLELMAELTPPNSGPQLELTAWSTSRSASTTRPAARR